MRNEWDGSEHVSSIIYHFYPGQQSPTKTKKYKGEEGSPVTGNLMLFVKYFMEEML